MKTMALCRLVELHKNESCSNCILAMKLFGVILVRMQMETLM